MANRLLRPSPGAPFPATLVIGITAILLTALIGTGLWAQSGQPAVIVNKSPTCGCCSRWIDHLRANGFRVDAHDVSDMERVRREAGVPPRLGSCHTARIGSYVIEGHVPATEIRRLLREAPPVQGLAVPGMPIGSPGMEMGARRQAYEVLAFDEAGRTSVYSHYPEEKSR
jgi:hypothetical protein